MRRAQVGQLIDALKHLLGGDRLREIVEFVAIGAGQIAAADGDDVRQKGWSVETRPSGFATIRERSVRPP